MRYYGSHDFSVITDYQLIEYTERTLYNILLGDFKIGLDGTGW